MKAGVMQTPADRSPFRAVQAARKTGGPGLKFYIGSMPQNGAALFNGAVNDIACASDVADHADTLSGHERAVCFNIPLQHAAS